MGSLGSGMRIQPHRLALLGTLPRKRETESATLTT
jgi:hypothetical protein